jgi:hypothetical protein
VALLLSGDRLGHVGWYDSSDHQRLVRNQRGGYSVAIGTQLFGSPSPAQEPDMLNIFVSPTTGMGPVVGQAPLTFGAGKPSGTFTGTDYSGAAVHGSFTC